MTSTELLEDAKRTHKQALAADLERLALRLERETYELHRYGFEGPEDTRLAFVRATLREIDDVMVRIGRVTK